MRAYVYGIVGGDATAGLGITGVDGIGPVYTVRHDGLAGVISDYHGEEFGTVSQERLLSYLLTHQRVVEHTLEHGAVVPVKFGTLLRDSQEVLELLSQGQRQFVDALASTQGKIEIEVAAVWDIGQTLKKTSQEDEVARFREAILDKGEPSLQDRVQLGQVVKACMDRRRRGYRERMVSFLRPLAVDVAINVLVTDELVMNVAFLVERDREAEFNEAIARLDDLFEKEITFRVIGPLPPYSFRTVEVAQITSEQVQEAQRTLGLGPTLSEAEVRKGYRRLAAQARRSLGLADQGAAERFAQLRQASELLLRYCRALEEVQNSGPHEYAHRKTGSLFFIALKRARGEEVLPALANWGAEHTP